MTVLPGTSNWLKGRGNASQMIDELVAAAIDGKIKTADHLSQQLEELNRENSELKTQLSQLQSQLQKETEQLPDYQVMRDQVLSSLKLGKQAPAYKNAAKVLDRFVEELQKSG